MIKKLPFFCLFVYALLNYSIAFAADLPKDYINKIQSTYKKYNSLKLVVETSMSNKVDGKSSASKPSKSTLLYKRPNKIFLNSTDKIFAINGKSAWIYSAAEKKYAKYKFDPKLIQTMAMSQPCIGSLGLLSGTNYAPVITKSSFGNDVMLNGNKCKVLKITFKDGVFAPKGVVVTQSLVVNSKYNILKNTISTIAHPSKLVKSKEKLPNTAESTISSKILLFQPNIAVADSAFNFTPPKGSKELEKPKTLPNPLNKPAAIFSFIDSDGKTKKISDFKGSKIVIYCWALPAAEKNLAEYQKFYKSYKDKAKILSVNFNTNTGEVDKYLKSKNINIAYIKPSKETIKIISEKYVLMGLPAVYMINSKGVLVSGTIGAPTEKEIITYFNKLK